VRVELVWARGCERRFETPRPLDSPCGGVRVASAGVVFFLGGFLVCVFFFLGFLFFFFFFFWWVLCEVPRCVVRSGVVLRREWRQNVQVVGRGTTPAARTVTGPLDTVLPSP